MKAQKPDGAPHPIDTPLLAVDRLTVRYETARGSVLAVDRASLAIRAGESVAIVGESGSGKSTLTTTIAGFLAAPTARVEAAGLRFDGRELDRSRTRVFPVRTPGISMVFQDTMTSLDPVWTIGSQLRSVLRATASSRAERSRAFVATAARDWLERVGLDDSERVLRAYPQELSGGMRQRAMLAIALCGRPRLLIADEPTSALDASLSREMMTLMSRLTAELDATLIVVTHDITLCMEYVDRLLVMKDGVIVDDVPAASVHRDARHPYTHGLLRCIPTFADVDRPLLPTLEDAMAEWERAS